MGDLRVVVLGGGMAGLAAALLLARDGHVVTVAERDWVELTRPEDSPAWDRRGIPHFLLPHAFLPRGREELRRHLPDVYDDVIAAGACEVDLRSKIRGPAQPQDDQLCYLGIRRPLIEWGLRRAVLAEPRITVRSGVHVEGLALEDGRSVGAVVDSDVIAADLVIDALGRRTPSDRWLADAGIEVTPPRTSDCGVVYYARYYRLRDGYELPDGPWALSPRGDLGYLGYATFIGDNRTFAALLATPNGTTAWRGLKDAAAFEAAVAQIPNLRAWVDPGATDPITPVLPMAGLRNGLRAAEPAVGAGVIPIGDALGHTDPVLAHGLAFALIHAVALASALREHDAVVDAGEAYLSAVMPLLSERYDLATALDEQRHRMWMGGPVDFAHRSGDYALFTVSAAAAAALADGDIFRVFMRRIGLLDSIAVLDDDPSMQQRIEEVFAQLTSVPRPTAGPEREEMLSLVSAHG